MSATAETETPSSRPSKPSRSVVVALTETQSTPIPMTSASVRRIRSMWGRSLGRCIRIVQSTTGIRIHANDDCEFDFSVRGELSVNGQKADEEVFSTLVDQLTADSFTLCDDFEPQNDALLTVTVYTDTQDFSASFYQEQGDSKYAYVVAGADNERFLKTDAWRVGTLLLTCEGTRIFDASGQETPVD